MPNRHSSMKIKFLVMTSLCAITPHQAFAQQLVSEWTPSGDSSGGYNDGYSPYGAEPVAPEAQPETRVSRSDRRSDANSGPRVDIAPYLEVQQVLDADLQNGGDVLTYTSLAAGIDASVQTRRAEAQVNVRYERVFGYDKGVDNQDLVSGLGRGSVALAPGFSVEAGGIATRTKVDGRGGGFANSIGNRDNVTQVYSVFGGPSLSTKAGPLEVNASYRAGYTKVESEDVESLPTGQERFVTFDDSTVHSVTASVGMQPGELPIGWSVGGGVTREDASVLDQRYDNKYVRGDITVPVSQEFALVGGIGYEDIEITERSAVLDGNGDPVLDNDGRFVTDSGSPRLVAWQEDGLLWDVGVMWKPSRRTSFSGYVGERYGSETFGANLTYQPNENFAFSASAYDTVSGYGNFLNNAISNLPTSFRSTRNPLSGDIGTCVFGQAGSSCLNGALQTANNAAFRARGVNAAITSKSGSWDTGIAVGYNQNKLLTSNLGAQAQLDGVVDENWFATGYVSKELDARSSIQTNSYVQLFDPGIAGANDVLSSGINAAYYRQITRGLSASIAAGVEAYDQKDFDKEVRGSALIGLRYTFGNR